MTITYLIITAGFIFGCLIGSFLNVCIYRLPLGKYEPVNPEAPGMDVTTPVTVSDPARSFCPRCKKQLSWYHNIPVLSWIFLGGKCAFCKQRISWRYPFVELLSGLSALLCIMRFGPSPTALLVFVFFAALIVITYIDLDYMIIPDVISLNGTAIALVIGLSQTIASHYNFGLFTFPVSNGILQSFLGILFGAGILYFFAQAYIWLRKKDGLGLGDVKLLALIGALFGPAASYFTIMVGSLIAIIIMVPSMLLTRRSMQNYLPFGPFLAFAAFLYAIGVGDAYFEMFRGFPAPEWWFTEMVK